MAIDLQNPLRVCAERCIDFGTAALRCLPPEMAHLLGVKILRSRLMDILPQPRLSRSTVGLETAIPGVGELPHPVGLAAGFDKNAVCVPALGRLGFSFVEIGTVTPRPQPGNPRPRVFRLASQRALINRMGFNSEGAMAVARRLSQLNWKHERCSLGINIGKNKDTPESGAVDDFVNTFQALRDFGRYFVVNISSPNTPGLRALARPDFIESLAFHLGDDRARIWIKLDPDLDRKAFNKLVEVIAKAGFQGIVLCNTQRVVAPESGGRSGHPLLAPATARLEWAWSVHRGELPMIAVGGILSGADVFQKMIRGALGVQIYTALVYQGPWVVAKLLNELREELKLHGFSTLREAVGRYYDA